MDSIRSQVVHNLRNYPDMAYLSAVKFAQGLRDTYRAIRGNILCVDFDKHTVQTKRPTPRSVLSVETSSTGACSDWDETNQEGVLSIEGQDARSYASRGSFLSSLTGTTRSPTYPPSGHSSDLINPYIRGAFIRYAPQPTPAVPLARFSPPPIRLTPTRTRDHHWPNFRLRFSPHH